MTLKDAHPQILPRSGKERGGRSRNKYLCGLECGGVCCSSPRGFHDKKSSCAISPQIIGSLLPTCHPTPRRQKEGEAGGARAP